MWHTRETGRLLLKPRCTVISFAVRLFCKERYFHFLSKKSHFYSTTCREKENVNFNYILSHTRRKTTFKSRNCDRLHRPVISGTLYIERSMSITLLDWPNLFAGRLCTVKVCKIQLDHICLKNLWRLFDKYALVKSTSKIFFKFCGPLRKPKLYSTLRIFLVFLCFLKRKGPLLRGPRGSFLSEKARSSNLISGPLWATGALKWAF